MVMINLTIQAASAPGPRPGRSCMASAMSNSGTGDRNARRRFGAGTVNAKAAEEGLDGAGEGEGGRGSA